MFFSINSDVLSKHIAIISKAQNTKNALPILDCILVEAEDGYVQLTASESDTYFTCRLETNEYDGKVKIALNGKQFYNSIKEIGDQPITIETHDNKNVCIRYQNGKYNLVSDDADMYPASTFIFGEYKGFTIDSESLKDGLNHCSWAIANDELRPQMSGVYLDTAKEGVIFVGTDGHKLVRDDFTRCECSGASFVIFPKPIKIILSMLSKETVDVSIMVAQKGDAATFRIGEYSLSFKLTEYKFPAYDSVIPKNNPFVAMVDKASMRSAVQRVLVCASSMDNLLKLHFEDGMLTISSADINYNTSAEESMSAEYSASPISIGQNGEFLKKLLDELPGERIRISMSEPTRAAIFEPEEESDNGERILMLLMPMMLQN